MTTGRINQGALFVGASAARRPWLARRQGRARARTTIVRGRAMTLAWYVGKGSRRPQTHMIFCIRSHEHARVIHIGNAEAARHAWDTRRVWRPSRPPPRGVAGE